MPKLKFTDKELELLDEMVQLPQAYNLTGYGIEVVRGLQEKIKKYTEE